ncbi:hypothetical protein BC834DRAFT_852936 [Gloeopeniophorella convolvens]|nr:hypothetical protein BC834DRAFT_852936 [Gloeopeniophorella convolvens]
MPPKLPQEAPEDKTEQDKTEREMNVALCHILIQAAQMFRHDLPLLQQPMWDQIIRMLQFVKQAADFPLEKDVIKKILSDMLVGDVFVMHVRAQNAGLVIRRLQDNVRFEMFEVSPRNEDVMSTEGKLLCSYPGPAIQVSTNTFLNHVFLSELASFLFQMDVDVLAAETTSKGGSTVIEVRESAHPRYITELLCGILRGFGEPAEVERITKRINDEVLWKDAYKPWRRSPLWLVLRIALQTTLRTDGVYKSFILFFHAEVLRLCTEQGLPSDLLHAMRCKIARRLCKIEPSVPDFVFGAVEKGSIKTDDVLQARWKKHQEKMSQPPEWRPETLNFDADTSISLDNSYDHLDRALRSESLHHANETSIPSHPLRLNNTRDFRLFKDGELQTRARSEPDPRIALADFELSVENHLEWWTTDARGDEFAPDVVASCAVQYFDLAKGRYKDSAEDGSIMILTMMALWMALDTIVCQQIPLLERYSPEIPEEILHPLLLHRRGALSHAARIEAHLHRRHGNVSVGTSIFSSDVSSTSFAVEYFRDSQEHRDIYQDILRNAQQEREEKRRELKELNVQRQDYSDRASRLEHRCGRGYSWCERCSLEQDARRMTIHVHEWPLPVHTTTAQMVVFELSPPRAFSAWRTITRMILHDLITPPTDPVSHDQSQMDLPNFSGLGRWVVRHPYHRISLGSTTKSFSDQAHYKSVQIPAEESSVCVNHGLTWQLFDADRRSWVERASPIFNVKHLCTPIVEAGPYSHLHFAVADTLHSSNDVIADQASCPDDLSLHEYLAFSTLRSGPRLQWLNIMRELGSSSLSFRREEVHTLITQAAWQLGPLAPNGGHEWHEDLEAPGFGNALLSQLDSLLQAIRANWLEEVSVRTIALLATRLLAAAQDDAVCQRAHTLLKSARDVAYQWMYNLDAELEKTTDDALFNELNQQLCQIAATCFLTFAPASKDIHAIFPSVTELSIAVHCAATVQNATPLLTDNTPPHLVRLLNRHNRLLHFLEPAFRLALSSHTLGFDMAMKCLWADFRRHESSGWRMHPSPDSRWACCTTFGGQEVQYNVLTGQLLVDGKPLGRLPREVLQHPTYVSLFGEKTPRVVPADGSGMEFQTRFSVAGHQVLFTRLGGDVILRARKPDDFGNSLSRFFQIIPRRILAGDFPKRLVDDYVHWLDLDNGEMEFRPVDSPWTSCASNWRLDLRSQPRVMTCNQVGDVTPTKLIDVRSDSFKSVFGLISALERHEYAIITRTNRGLEASLHRLRLSFSVSHHGLELECQTMPGYVVDRESQSSGTMFGLRNQLILRPQRATPSVQLQPRRAIIPHGEVSFTLDGDFAAVLVETGTETHVKWHDYAIDPDVGSLKESGSLTSRLYKCYLHATTSHCLPDPLLGRTGTEEALFMLQTAACHSFQRLDARDAKLLASIADLSPLRVYYPKHLRSMTTVHWKDIPALSQHDAFYPAVRRVFDHALAMETLHDPPTSFDFVIRKHDRLLDRAASRNARYYPRDVLKSLRVSVPQDMKYLSRQVPHEADGTEILAYKTSKSLFDNQPVFEDERFNLWNVFKSWGTIGAAISSVSLSYSRHWLEFDARRDWLLVYSLCQEALERNSQDVRIQLAFSLSAASYSRTEYAHFLPLVQILATDPRFLGQPLPSPRQYAISDGLSPTPEPYLTSLIRQFALPFDRTPARFLQVDGDWSWVYWRRNEEYRSNINAQASSIANSVASRWPSRPSFLVDQEWFDKPGCERKIDEYLTSVDSNVQLDIHTRYLQREVVKHYLGTGPVYVAVPPYTFSCRFQTHLRGEALCSISDVLESHSDALEPPTVGQPVLDVHALGLEPGLLDASAPSLSSLRSVVEELEQRGESTLHQVYGQGLRESFSAFLAHGVHSPSHAKLPPRDQIRPVLTSYHEKCHRWQEAEFSRISRALSPSSSRRAEKIVERAGLWPRITPRSVLHELTMNRARKLPNPWKTAVTQYAVAFLHYQQSRRLLDLSNLEGRDEQFRRGIESVAEDVPLDPDWLLLQIDADIRVRPIQIDIARKMISPSDGTKSSISMQLNMGEGKTTVILPSVSATLADGSTLVRVVTLKPLSNQVFQLLVNRLAGLANRPIFYIPFSRNLRITPSTIQAIKALYERCVREGGVLVTQPEYILSQKLMCIDTLLTPDRDAIARELNELQDWLAQVTRDVLDESDEILHTRYQLVYTIGEQKPVEDHPNRWTMIQQVFSTLQEHAATLRDEFREEFDHQSGGGLPITRFLNHAVSLKASSLLAKAILDSESHLSDLSFSVLSAEIKGAAERFMVNKDISAEDYDLVHSHCAGTRLWSALLLLRGLLMDGQGILGYVLMERRWKVDFGLDPNRTLLAVPYRAKDVPSLRAEFGHPDVAISLTCLSYHYGGLTREQVLQCLDLLNKLDNPEVEYESWVQSEEGVHESQRQLKGVNTKDKAQIDALLDLLSRNARVIDFYLSHVVFPRAAKEFPHKLSTSGWDLVEEKAKITTGFSGTNDSRYLLPTSISHKDHESQLGTNALVLRYLLQPENNFYECTQDENGQRESAAAFLTRLVGERPEIRVLLDVGAQMLEFQNEELVRRWLECLQDPGVSAAIFLNDSDELTVLSRDGTKEPLISSPFNRQLEKCIVYLDEAHTRGTDLKLPQQTRAAVTLGPKLTKDRLVQACMRMRQLCKGQSVMFFAPGEVDRRIRSLIPDYPGPSHQIQVQDVLRWAMDETCEDISRHLPQWVEQGISHHRRFVAYKARKDAETLRSAWQEPESKTLEQLYDPRSNSVPMDLTSQMDDIPDPMRERLELLGISRLGDARMAEEQEREVSHEAERERQVQRPPKVEPARHSISEDIRRFVRTGEVPSGSMTISSLFAPLGAGAAQGMEWSPFSLATADFAATTAGSNGMCLTDYLRPVNWILSSGSEKQSTTGIVVISPYEANELLPEIRRSNKVRLHLYAPRVTASMRSLSDLTFYCIPEIPAQSQWSAPVHVRTEINLWAGQLYFDDEAEYKRFCVLFALSAAHPDAKCIEVDGFVKPEHRTGESSPFTKSQVAKIKDLTALRRKGMGFSGTHVGRVLAARRLGKKDFELPRATKEVRLQLYSALSASVYYILLFLGTTYVYTVCT